MRYLLSQIGAATQAGLSFVSLFTALSIPDICAALEAPDGEANGKRYAEWYDRNVATGPANGQDIYYFRCSLLHQGRMANPHSSFSRIIFIEPGATTNVFHNCIVRDALLIDVRLFVADIITAAERWLPSVENGEIFKINLVAFVARHPGGIIPYIVGVPVIG
jgi:hypothetical protein